MVMSWRKPYSLAFLSGEALFICSGKKFLDKLTWRGREPPSPMPPRRPETARILLSAWAKRIFRLHCNMVGSGKSEDPRMSPLLESPVMSLFTERKRHNVKVVS